MTKEEAIFCEKSYIGETNCKDCNYYGTNTCLSRESHKMAIKALSKLQKIEDIIKDSDNIGLAITEDVFFERIVEVIKND